LCEENSVTLVQYHYPYKCRDIKAFGAWKSINSLYPFPVSPLPSSFPDQHSGSFFFATIKMQYATKLVVVLAAVAAASPLKPVSNENSLSSYQDEAEVQINSRRDVDDADAEARHKPKKPKKHDWDGEYKDHHDYGFGFGFGVGGGLPGFASSSSAVSTVSSTSSASTASSSMCS